MLLSSMQSNSIGFMGIMMIVMMGAMLFVLIFRSKKGKRRLFRKKQQSQVTPKTSSINTTEFHQHTPHL